MLAPPKEGTVGALEFPALVHRLDMPTSGLLLIAKTHSAAVNLSEQFATRKVKKTYIACLQGVPSERVMRIDFPIDGKSAVTEWRILRRIRSTKGPLTLVEFRPLHGRKHQLRIHAVSILFIHSLIPELVQSLQLVLFVVTGSRMSHCG